MDNWTSLHGADIFVTQEEEEDYAFLKLDVVTLKSSRSNRSHSMKP